MADEDNEITIRLNRETARIVRDALHSLGEHQAAGLPLPDTIDPDVAHRLASFITELTRQLGGSGRVA
jgi:hypothetical protein